METPVIKAFLDKHSLTQREVSEGSGIPLSAVNAIIRGHRSPRTETVNKLLAFCRSLDPSITYEQLFGAEDGEPVAAAGGSR